MNKRKLLAGALALLLGVLPLTACGGGASAANMRLRRTEGTVAVRDDGGADVTPKENLNLYSGYAVATQAASYAWIDLDAAKLTKLDENSEAAVTKEGKALTLDVRTGNLYFDITEPLAEDETLDIQTSTMVTAIRGTRGWVTQESVCLLEGTVTVTAGEQSVTVNAGQMARFTPDGTLEAAALPYQDLPAFVTAETPPPEEGALPATYEEQLAALENVVYAEMVDFEKDGAPELLAVSIELKPERAVESPSFGYGSIDINVYRQEEDGVHRLTHMGDNMYPVGNVSLVERDGRQYVRFYRVYRGLEGYQHDGGFVSYAGPAVPTDGGSTVWGMVYEMQLQYVKLTDNFSYFWGWPHGENGLTDDGGWMSYLELGYSSPDEAYEAETNKYTHVRDLVSYEGPDVTVHAP